jgi:hypothetical protein
MKKALSVSFLAIFLLVLKGMSSPVEAACSWSLNPASGAVTASTCGIDAASSEYYDYSSATDDATNGYTVTIPAGVTVTVNAGTDSSHKTLLQLGKFSLTGGSLAVSASNINVGVGLKCYVVDSDGDFYSPSPTTCSTTGGAGYIRRNKLLSTAVDCGDGNASAKPGQTTYATGTFVNGVNGALTHDWNCDGSETKGFNRIYSCNACTNGSGYASFQAALSGTQNAGNSENATDGWLTSAPACNTAATRYTVTNATCKDPATADCSAAVTTASVTQACL